MDMERLGGLLGAQEGVVSRGQALALGLDDNDLERLVRRRGLARVHPGVFVDHTGPPTWSQRAWAAVLYHAPAALGGVSALRAYGLRSALPVGSDRPFGGHGSQRQRSVIARPREAIEVVVDARRRLIPPEGVVLTRRVDFEGRTLLNLSPPRLRIEEALLDVASAAATEADAVGWLADACQEGATTAVRLQQTLQRRGRLPRRRLLLDVLDDVAGGAMSVLERRYLVLVERAHGLPTARRQVRTVLRAGTIYRDVEYADHGVVVELDGRLAHARPDRAWVDLERDVEATVRGEASVRLGWAHVLDPCRAALLVSSLLRARGWSGLPRACGVTCRSVPVGRGAA